jgi:predicted MFS family arabinose efflux permease
MTCAEHNTVAGLLFALGLASGVGSWANGWLRARRDARVMNERARARLGLNARAGRAP